MGAAAGPDIIQDGLVLCLDAGNRASYSSVGTAWNDLSNSSNNGTLINGVGYTGPYNTNGGNLIFDGTDDYISSSFATTSNQSVTYAGWLYSTETTATYRNFVDSVTVRPMIWWNNSGQIEFDIDFYTTPAVYRNQWVYVALSKPSGSSSASYYVNGVLAGTGSAYTTSALTPTLLNRGGGQTWKGNCSNIQIYNRALTPAEVFQNYNATKPRFNFDQSNFGSLSNPLPSPVFAQNNNFPAGSYYFSSGSMSSPLLLEYQPSYYESRPFCCVFRSPYRSTATTNRIDLNIPMGGLLVQRDTLDLRAAVYWSTPITYNSVGGSGNNTANSGYSPRRVMLGGSGGHGIYATNQNQCSWGAATGAIGAGWDGGTCGSFPNDLVWGTGRSDTATYENRSGVWSHWITWG